MNNKNTAIESLKIEFCITVISSIAIICLLICDLYEKSMRVQLAKIGLVEKVENNKVIWVKP